MPLEQCSGDDRANGEARLDASKGGDAAAGGMGASASGEVDARRGAARAAADRGGADAAGEEVHEESAAEPFEAGEVADVRAPREGAGFSVPNLPEAARGRRAEVCPRDHP